MRTWTFASASSLHKSYTVTHADNGLLGCDCKGWTIKKPDKPRECKHITEVIERHGLVREVRGEYVFAAPPTEEGQKIVENIPENLLTQPADDSIIVLSGREVTTMARGTAVTAAGTVLEGMKACAMTDGKFGHILDADGFVIPEKFDVAFGNGQWVMDEKLDGHRCLITKNGDSVSTTLRSIPTLPVQILNQMASMPDGVYDGELLVPGGVSTDVPNLALRDELIFAMFDVVELAGQSVMHLPLSERRELLLVAASFAPGDAVVCCAQFAPTWAAVKAIWANDGEGVILKKISSVYRPGYRTADWIKVKRLEQHTVIVTGFEAGSLGSTAVTLFQFEDGTTGRCKTLNNEELAQTSANPEAFIGRRLVVQCQQRMRGSKSPRHPMWDHWAGDGE